MIINKQYIEIKSALRKKTKLVDTYFLSKYSFSPYRACQHACKYCDGRAEKYYVDGDFEKDIVIRKNLPILLEKELGKIREKGTISIGSGVSDAYQPIEKEEEIMRKCAEILSNHNLSAFVMTKSSLIMRDIDIWEKVHKKSGFTLMISLTFADSSYEHIREIFEPNVSSIEERFETLRAFKKRGMYIGVLAMPFIPYITDSEENILKLFENLKKIGTDFIVPGGLSLRPGKQKDVFMEVIKDKFPHLSKKIEIIYKENRQSGNSIFSYRKQFYRKMEKIFSLPSVAPVLTETPHRIYKNCFPIYDEIYILLNHLKILYSRKGVNISPLKRSLQKYTEWLLEEKKVFNRSRKLSYKDIENKLFFLINNGKLLENEKLSNFIKKVAIERMTFDYINLKLY